MVPATTRAAAPPLVVAGLVVWALVLAACGAGSPPRAAPAGPPTSELSAAPAYRWSRLAEPSLNVGGGAAATIAAVVAPAGPGQQWTAVGTRTAPGTAGPPAAGAAPGTAGLPAAGAAPGTAGIPAAGAAPGTAGAAPGTAGAATATVWTSPDARHWAAAALPGTGSVSQARAASRLGATTIVVGSAGSGGSQRAAAWLSAGSGRPWKAVTSAAFAPSPAPPVTGTVASADSGQGAVMDHVATGAIGAFAVGTDRGATAVWYSTDGSRWTRLSTAEKVIDSADQAQVNTLMVTASGVVAAGTVVDGTDLDAAVWKSTDGIHWSRVMSAQRSFAGNGDHVISDIAPLGTGFVAVGAVRPATQWLPASWISPDGTSWSAVSSAFPQAPALNAGGQGTVVAAVAAAPGTGGLVAVGGGLGTLGAGPAGVGLGAAGGPVVAGRPGLPRMWTSTDGLSWSEAPLAAPASTTSGWRLGLVASAGGTTVVADDTVGEPRMLAYVGAAWSDVSADPSNFGVPATVATPTSLVSRGGNLYLSIDVDTPSQALRPASEWAEVLTSADGTHWKLSAAGGPLAGHRVDGLLAVPGGLAAAGGTAAGGSPVPPPAATVWSSPDATTWTPAPNPAAAGANPAFGGMPEDPARALGLARVGSKLVAVGTKAGSAVAWTSAGGGGRWQPEGTLDASPGLGTEVPYGACAGPQSVVAVGTGQVGVAGSQAEAWSSPDGRSWWAASVSPAQTPGEEEEMTGCLTTGNAFLAYGGSAGPHGTTDPALWQSTDGTAWGRQSVVAFAGDGGGGITDLALRGATWLAVSGAAGAVPVASSAAARVSLWRSEDAGGTWQQVGADGVPWTARLYSQADLVGFAGATAVVVGQVDGGLAVWVGTTPAPGAARA